MYILIFVTEILNIKILGQNGKAIALCRAILDQKLNFSQIFSKWLGKLLNTLEEMSDAYLSDYLLSNKVFIHKYFLNMETSELKFDTCQAVTISHKAVG